MLACPDCKKQLQELKCVTCGSRFSRSPSGIPILVSLKATDPGITVISDAYDEIYEARTGVWVDQGRTDDFLRYFAALLNGFSPERILEIGCGEGFLLEAVRHRSPAAIDVSEKALARARNRCTPEATLAVAFAESLPFVGDCFDVVYSVGVMEHFADDVGANKEIYRVLRPGGKNVVLIHTKLNVFQKVAQKLREYVFPAPRMGALLTWLGSKLKKPIHQPIQHHYTVASARQVLESAGFVVNEIRTTTTHPSAPFIGPHVVAFVASKPS